MIKYIPKPIPITTEEEKTLKRLAHEEYEKQKKNPTEIFWWLKQPYSPKILASNV